MASLVMAFIIVLLTSLAPLSIDGLSWPVVIGMAAATLVLWPLVALMRRIVGMAYTILTGRRAP